MFEKDVRLLFDAGHWESAIMTRSPCQQGWCVNLHPRNKNHPAQTLASKRENPRVFKAADTALLWCKEIGFDHVLISFSNDLDTISQTSAHPPFHTSGDTVLLVEDNNDDIAITLHAFKKHGIKSQVIVTTDGEEALEYLFAQGRYKDRNAAEVPRLVLLDLKLPKINGLEVLKKIRENPVTSFIPVVLLTTSDEHSDVIEGYKLGSNSYIKKPESYDVFEDVVSNLTRYWLGFNTPPPDGRYQ